MLSKGRLLSGVFIGSLAALMASPAVAEERGKVMARAEIFGCADPAIEGSALLLEEKTDQGVKTVTITMQVRGLSDGEHGVHIHETGNCAPCGAAGGHFDPGPDGNPSPDGNHPYHLGDLINIDATGGVGVLHVTTTRVTLSEGPLSVDDDDGSAFIVHVNPDSFCPDGVVAGCAGGGRDACGIIELLE